MYLANGKGYGWFAWTCRWLRLLILLVVLYTGPFIKVSYFACYFGRSFWGYGSGPPTTGISICTPLQRQCSLSACTCGWACHGWCFSPPTCKFSQWSLKLNIKESCNGRWGIELVDYWIPCWSWLINVCDCLQIKGIKQFAHVVKMRIYHCRVYSPP